MDGSISFGQYDVIERLRVGGSTETLRARDSRTDSLVALTRMLPETAGDPARRRALEDEARVAGSLDHPHIARLLDSGEIDGCWFVAYEHVEGRDLRRILEHASSELEPLALPFVLHVARRVAEAVAHAHEAAPPLVHGCLTPQNITVSFAGDVKVVGFGADKPSLGYKSPEQLRGGPIDLRTDLFSLGICLWEALTARRLFPERDEALAVDVLARWSPEPPSRRRPDLPPELDRIVMKLLAKDATERYGSARRFSGDLSNFVAKSEARASREDVARYMRETFDDEATRSTGRTMELQETRRMSDDKNGGGSDLDIFEGLGKKSSATTAAVPPPPPGSGAHVAGAVAPKPTELKKTLLGIAQPAQPPSAQNLPAVQPSSQTNMPAVRPSSPPLRGAPPSADGMTSPPASGSMRAAQPVSQPPAPVGSKPPPPPPGRGSLPNLAAQPASQPPMSASPSATQKSAPPPVPAAPSTRPTAVAQAAASSQPNGTKLDMDWDDDDEATHVFDKESRDNQKAAEAAPLGEREPDRADMDAILSSPPRTSSVPMPAAGTPPPPPSTLSGAFASLGQTNGSQPPSAAFKSGPPASQSIRSAPPPPPVSARSPSQSPISAVPPPPPPGSPTTQPMHMPPRPPSAPPPSGAHPAHAQQVPGGGGMHQPMSNFPSAPPISHAQPQQPVPTIPQMPPVSRMMEPTAIVPRAQPSRAGLWVGLLVAVMAIVGIAVYLLMPRTGTLVVNVADAKGASVPNLQVLIDGTKKCDSAPCILKDIPAGVHEVRVSAPGYDTLAPRAITVEARRDATTDFTLAGGKSVGGTGFKVAGNQPGVKVSVDGKDLGTLPAEAHDLEPGDHKLHFSGSDRYAPLDKSISIGKDEIVDVGNIQLKVLKGKAMITLGTPGAKVFLVSGATRKEVPQFPIAIDFDPNEHWQLEAKKDGFDDFVKPISFDDGIAEKTIDVTLSPKGSHATQPQSQLASPPPVAQAPVVRQQPVAKAEPPAAKEPSDSTPAPKAAAAGESFLNINSLPASTVVLDGKPLGPTPRVHVQVSPGSHTIMFVNAEQSLKKSISVTVGAGETKAAFAKLRE